MTFSLFGLKSLFNKKAKHNGQNEATISSTETELIYNYPATNEIIHLPISTLSEVIIKTTDLGPAVCDVFMVLTDESGKEFITPQDDKYADVVVDWILKLPDFNHQAFIEAMACAENRLHLVWKNGAPSSI